jgi:hypothetical protein
MILSNELERVWKIMVVTYVKVLYRQVFRETEITRKMPFRTFGFLAGIWKDLSNKGKKVTA